MRDRRSTEDCLPTPLPKQWKMESFAPLSWETLPAEILEIVFSKIYHQKHLGLLRLVNSSWCSAINRNIKSLELKTRKACTGGIESLGRTFTRLERLEIYSKDEDIFRKLSSIKSLTELDLGCSLWGSTPKTTYTGVELLTNLVTLKLTSFELEPNFMEMCTPSHLKSLSLRDRAGMERSFGQLADMTNLTRLDLHQFHLTNVEFLSGLTNLEVLDLENWFCGFCYLDVSPLSSMVNLTRLRLRNFSIVRSDFDNMLANLKNLIWLDIDF